MFLSTAAWHLKEDFDLDSRYNYPLVLEPATASHSSPELFCPFPPSIDWPDSVKLESPRKQPHLCFICLLFLGKAVK